MDAQSGAGIRQRKHNHYLKGTVWCGRCGRRMVISVAKGIYDYYMCRGRQSRDCDLPYLPVDKIEQAVIDHYATVAFPEEFRAAVRSQFDQELAASADNNTQLRQTLDERLTALSVKEDHYLDLVGDPVRPTDKLRDKITQIRTQREKITIELGALDANINTGRDIFVTALTLMANPQQLYRTCTTAQRKILNTVIFTKLKIDTTGVTGDELAEPFDALVPAARHYTHCGTLPSPRRAPEATDTPRTGQHGGQAHPEPAYSGHSSSKTTWVRPKGFEPPTF